MPNGQGGEERFEQESMVQRWELRRAELASQEYYRTISSTFTVSGDCIDASTILFHSPPPKPPRRPTRPVSAIFYPMVNECGY